MNLFMVLQVHFTPEQIAMFKEQIYHPHVAFLGALLGAVAGLGSQLLGGAQQNKANRESMQWQEHMYDRQRADALADWNRNNEYNSPIAQMARLKAGGLNPALFYGGGTSGITSAAPIRSSSPGSYKAEAFKPDLGAVMQGAADLLLKKKQAQNMDAQNDLIHAQAEETRSRIPKNQAETENVTQDSKYKERVQDILVALKQQEYEKLWNETQSAAQNVSLAAQKNAREEALNGATVDKIVAETTKTHAETKNIKLTYDEIQKKIDSLGLRNKLDEMEVEWKKQGFTSHDNVIFRAILGISQEIFKSLSGISLKGPGRQGTGSGVE